MAQLRELSKQKPRGKTDDSLVSEISRLESAIQLAKDELVSLIQLMFVLLSIYFTECHQLIAHGYQRRVETFGEGNQE